MLKAAITYYQACSLDLNSQEQLFRSNQMIVGQEGRKGRRQRRRQTASSGVSLVRGLLVSGRRRAGTRVLMPLTTRQPATTPSLLDHHQPSCVLPPIHSTSSQAGEKKKKNPTASRFACGCFRIPPASSLGDSRQRPPPPPPRRPPPIKSRPFFFVLPPGTGRFGSILRSAAGVGNGCSSADFCRVKNYHPAARFRFPPFNRPFLSIF
jgi:hypothetical protein